MTEAATLDLHERQWRILQFIRWSIVEQERVPTVREIGKHTGIPSPGMVNYYLDALQRMGLIDKEPYKARTLRLTRRGLECLQGTEAAT